MSWQTTVLGIALIVGSLALALWANESRHRQGRRFRERLERERGDGSPPEPDA